MPGHDIIVIGASAGGVKALIQLVAGLPENLPAAILTAKRTSVSQSGWYFLLFSGRIRQLLTPFY